MSDMSLLTKEIQVKQVMYVHANVASVHANVYPEVTGTGAVQKSVIQSHKISVTVKLLIKMHTR